MLGHNVNYNKFPKNKILKSMFSDYSGFELEILKKTKPTKS